MNTQKALVTVVLLLMCLMSSIAVASNSVTLTMWHYWDGANGKVLEELIERFEEENPDINIEAIFVPGSDLMTKLRTGMVANQVPDIAVVDLINMPMLVRSGRLVPLDDFIAASSLDLSDFYSAPMSYGEYEGKRYSLPVSASNLGLYWNKNLYAQAGHDPDTPPKTWDELIEFSKQIKKETGKWGFELYTQGGEGTTWQWQVFLWSAGGEFLSADLTSPAFNSEAGEMALELWIDMIGEHQVSTIAPWGLFGRGEAAMVMDGSWMTEFFPMQVDFPLGAAVFPAPTDGEPATNMGGEQIFIMSPNADAQEAAWRFIEWFVSTSVQVEWNKGTGFIPVLRSVSEDPSYLAWVANARPLLRPFVEAQQHAHARPAVENYAQISDIVARYIVEALYGRRSARDALDYAADLVKDLL